MRTIARSSSNMNSASARASSVLPTPVGPRNTNEPIGRFGSCRPERARRSAFATAETASSCPTTRSCSRSSMWISFSVSPSSSRETGMPVQRRDDLGDVVLVHLFLDHRGLDLLARSRAPPRARAARRSGSRRRAGGCPRAPRARPPSFSSSIRRVISLMRSSAPFSCSQRAASSLRRSLASASSRSSGSRTCFDSLPIAASSISSWRTRRSASSSSSGRGVDLHAQPRGGLVDQVDRLVRQLPVGDVAVGEDGRGDQRRVADADAVVRLVALLQAAQDRDRVGDRRLADEDRLEAALERGVLLDVLAVLVERGRADRAQLAAREHRLQHVGRVDRALGRAGSDDRVQLVDEEDDLALRRLDLVEDGLEPLLELAAVLRAGEERTDVERPDALALQPLGDVAGDDPLRESLRDRGLPHARLADQHRVVLRPARQHLDDAADLLVATDDRVELSLLGERGQVAAELLERLVGLLGILGGDPLAAADVLDALEQHVAGDDVEREQQVLGGDVLVVQLLRLVEGTVKNLGEGGADLRLLLRALDGGLCRQPSLGLGAERRSRLDELLRQLLVEECEQQVLGVDLRVAHPARELLRAADGFLRLERELVEVHQLTARDTSPTPHPGWGVVVRPPPAASVTRKSSRKPDGTAPTMEIREPVIAASSAPAARPASRARGRAGTAGEPCRSRRASGARSGPFAPACAGADPPCAARARRRPD